MSDKKQAGPVAPAVCPVCGEDVPPGSVACPECGADHKSGWREDAATYDAVDLPDEHFDYDQFAREEFGKAIPSKARIVYWITAVVIILVFWAIYFSALRQ